MGNICGYVQPKWSEKMVINSWIPMLAHLFKFDANGVVESLDEETVRNDPLLAKEQLSTLTVLLKKRTGVKKPLLEKIKSLHDSIKA